MYKNKKTNEKSLNKFTKEKSKKKRKTEKCKKFIKEWEQRKISHKNL